MKSDDSFDLDAYFARIGYDRPCAPTLETLRAIQLRHSQAIAFENLNPLLALPVRLDIESLQQKLIRSRRGGLRSVWEKAVNSRSNSSVGQMMRLMGRIGCKETFTRPLTTFGSSLQPKFLKEYH